MRNHHVLDGIPAQLWRLVSLARHRLLMLDFDGTLVPFTSARDAARSVTRSLELVRDVVAHGATSIAVVSGRPLHELEKVISGFPAWLIGEHGWESRAPDGTLACEPLEPRVVRALDLAEAVARRSGWGDLLERKRTAMVLHTRVLPACRARDAEARCETAWRGLARPGGMRVDRIAGGVELRPRGRDKGTVVRTLLGGSMPATLGVFVGDDVADEDAFEAVRDYGFGVQVGGGVRPTLAMARIGSPEAVPQFLEQWLEVASAPGRLGR